MKFGRKPIQWKKIIRRSFALCFATIALWLLGLTCDFGAACMRLGESSAFVSAALRAELGCFACIDDEWGQLDRWQRLALNQSPYFRFEGVLMEQPVPSQQVPSPAPSVSEIPNEEPSPVTTSPTQTVPEHTILAADSAGYIETQGIHLLNYTNTALDLQAVSAAKVGVELSSEGPQILIMHTHGSEAYTMDGDDIYQESDSWRTTDENYNVTRIGAEMKQVFESMGLSVIHDRTLHDYPQYNDSYTRSCDAVKKWLEQYPSIQIVLDVHRDALADADGSIYKPIADIEGEKSAQVLLIVGTNDLGQDHPNWMQNLALAVQIQQQLDRQWPTLARPLTLRSSRFNQQLTQGSLLVEVGSHGNTLQEALQAARLFAAEAGKVFLSLK